MMYCPGKTPGVISGHKSIAPSSAASKTTDMSSALRRRLRAWPRDSASFSSMHRDRLPRSLTDTPPRNRWHARERHLGAAKEAMARLHAAGTRIPAGPRLMVLRSSRDLCRDRHRGP